MFGIGDILKAIVGGGAAGAVAPSRKPIPEAMRNIGGAGAMRQKFEIPQRRQKIQRAPLLPQRQSAPNLQYQRPSQRDFPNQTNYGTPQDSMIDMPIGYTTRPQYDQAVNSHEGERGYMNPVQGGGSLYRQQQPSLQGMDDSLQNYLQQLRVR